MIVARHSVPFKKGALKWQTQSGYYLARRVVIRGLMFAIAISVLPLMQVLYNIDPSSQFSPDPIDECDADMGFLDLNSYLGRVLKPVTPLVFPHIGYAKCRENVNLTIELVRELDDKRLLNYASRTLCLGRESASTVSLLRKLGFTNVDGVHRHPFFALKQKQVTYKLEAEHNSFSFVVARDLDKVAVPALFVSEVERILKPGGLGVILVENDGYQARDMVRAATPISSYLKSSSVIHVAGLMSHVMVVFRKNFPDHVNSLIRYSLPADCASIRRNRIFIDRMEPLVEVKPTDYWRRITYLPSFIDVTAKKRLVYIDTGKKEAVDFSHSNWFLPLYPIDSRAFSAYIVDHNALVLSSHVQKPGVTFIYHPGLNANPATKTDRQRLEFLPLDEYEDEDDHDEDDNDGEDFDFLAWFKETVQFSDFVVLKMNAGRVELKFLFQLFESGAICFVDELFLQCSDFLDGSGFDGSCMDLFRDLRSRGVFVHQWWVN